MARSIDIPQFLKIDFKEKKISGKTASEEIRNAKIQSMYRLDGKLILQGTQNAMAWSMVITEATQKMTLTASGDEAGFGGAESRYAAEAEILDSQTKQRLASAVDRRGGAKYQMNKRAVQFFVLFFFCSCQTAFAQSIFVGPDKKFEQKELRVPYAFYNDSFGTAVGFVYGITGYPQKQSMLLGTAMAGTEGSVMGFLMGRDLRLPFSDRLFLRVPHWAASGGCGDIHHRASMTRRASAMQPSTE